MSTTFASQTLIGEIGAVDESFLTKHRELARLPELRLAEEALRTLRFELDLPADERRRHVVARLRAWLNLDAADARRIALAFDAALDRLDADERHTVRETEEDAVMDGLSYREFERLAAFMPSLQQWQSKLWEALPPKSGVPGSFAAALAMAGMASDLW